MDKNATCQHRPLNLAQPQSFHLRSKSYSSFSLIIPGHPGPPSGFVVGQISNAPKAFAQRAPQGNIIMIELFVIDFLQKLEHEHVNKRYGR